MVGIECERLPMCMEFAANRLFCLPVSIRIVNIDDMKIACAHKLSQFCFCCQDILVAFLLLRMLLKFFIQGTNLSILSLNCGLVTRSFRLQSLETFFCFHLCSACDLELSRQREDFFLHSSCRLLQFCVLTISELKVVLNPRPFGL